MLVGEWSGTSEIHESIVDLHTSCNVDILKMIRLVQSHTASQHYYLIFLQQFIVVVVWQ